MTQPVVCPSCRKLNTHNARFCQHCGHDVILNNAGPRYFLTRVIKEGGQGAVYEGRGEDGTVYAVKEMLDHFTEPNERAEAAARFMAEAETLRRLSDPRIPRVFASFNDEGRHYLVMEFIRGEDLDELVSREGAQPESRVLHWADELCDVLEYLHAQDVIYRDMKPSNVMLEQPSGQLKLIDFGIAKVFQPQARGTQIGTPGYAPPEQYQGMATKVSDVYALGATLHHLLSGRDPQKQPPFAYPLLRDVVPTISPQTEAAVARALQMRQEDRFQSIADFRAALLPAPVAQVIAPAAAKGAPAVSSPAPVGQPVTPARPAPVATPPAPATNPAPTVPIAPPVAAAAPTRKRGCGGFVAFLVVLLLLGAGAAAFFFLRTVPPANPAVTSTAMVLVERPFNHDIELVIPGATDEQALNKAFVEAFLSFARIDCSCEPQIKPDSLIYLSAPVELSKEVNGTRYRASLQATLLVPQR